MIVKNDAEYFSQAIRTLSPTTGFVIRGDSTYSNIEWLDANETYPTEQEILDKVEELKADFEAKEYQRKRVFEYPSIGDQLDALFHAGVFPSDMAEQIQAIKDKYPKV